MPDIDELSKPRIAQESVNTLMRIRSQQIERRDRLLPAWMSISQYFNPALSDWDEYNDEMDQAPDYRSVYDNVGMKDSANLADGVQGWSFSRSSAWQRLTTEDTDLADRDDVKLYLQEMAVHFYKQLAKSSFYDEGRNLVRNTTDFGTGVMFRTNNVARAIPSYKTLHPKRAIIMEDENGEVDTLFRDLWLSSDQAVSLFGKAGIPKESLPRKIQSDYDHGDGKRFAFIQFIFPISKFDLDIGLRASRGRPYYSLYISRSGDVAVAEGGYWYKPFFGWRWSRNPDGSPYGTDCPGLMEISNVKQLNVMRKDLIRISALNARPPLKATSRLKNRIQNIPNGVTLLKAGEDFTRAITTGDIRPMMEDLAAIQTSVHETYHRSLFLVLTENLDRTKTATEVEGIKGEQAAMLTAFYGRMAVEFLEPAVEDLYQLEIDAGRAPERPDVLRGERVKIDLVSPLAMLQKRYLMLDSTRQWLNEIITIQQTFDPNAGDHVNVEQYIRRAADLYNVDRTVVRDIVEVRRRQAIRAQQEAIQRETERQASQADAAAKLQSASVKAPEPGSPAAVS